MITSSSNRKVKQVAQWRDRADKRREAGIFLVEGFKVFLEAPVLKKSGNFLIDLARRLVYGAKELLYRYGKLCGRLFGESKAALVLGILIPLAIGLSIAGAFWTAEWLKNRPEKKSAEPKEGKGEGALNEQTEVSGETAERS